MRLNHSFLALLMIIAGILAAAFINFPALGWLLGGLFFLCLSICMMLLNRRRFGWLLVVCFFSSGGFLFAMAREQYFQDLSHNRVFAEKTITLEGVMIERPKVTAKRTQFLFKTDTNLKQVPYGKITVYSWRPLPDNICFGRKLRLTGRFKLIQSRRRGFPDFPEQNGITGLFYLSQTPELLKGYGLPAPFIWADRLRNSLTGAGDKVLQPENTRFLHSMIFGDNLANKGPDGQLLHDLRRTGTIHLISVSGLHIGFILISLTFLLGWLKVPKKRRILPIAFCVCFYIMMTGIEPPVMRAGLMVLLYLFADYLGVADNNLNRLSLAAILLLWLNPYNLFSIGFQLSFLATLGVVWLFPQLKEVFKVKNPLLQLIWDGVGISLGAQLMVTPLTVNYFQMISWVSPLVNLLMIIPGEIIVIGGLTGEGLYLLFPWLGQMVLTIVNWVITLTRSIAHLFGSHPWAASVVPPWPWPWVVGYYLGIIFLLVLLRPNLLTGKSRLNKGSVIIGLMIIFNLIIWAVFINGIQEEYLQVSFIDVGQGDAIFIKTADGSASLVDGGDETKGINKVIPFLNRNGVSRLDQVFVTHYHQDHLAGLTEVLEEVTGNILYLPPASPDSASEEFIQRIKKLKIKRCYVSSGMRFKLGTSVTGMVLLVPEPESENDTSQVLLINYGKNKLLLTGDLTIKGEAVLARKYPDLLRSAVLKVGHHGSDLSTSLSFLTQVKPKLAVISVGAGNRFGHPGNMTLNRLRSLGVTVYRTDLSGTVTLRIYKDRIVATNTKR